MSEFIVYASFYTWLIHQCFGTYTVYKGALVEQGIFFYLQRMYEFTYFHTFISLIGLTFRTYTLYLRKVIKNRTFKSLIHKGSELILGIEGKVVKGL